jgi:hypothetical protein
METELRRGLLSLVLSLLIFSLFVYSATVENASPARLGLLNTFKSIFYLDDSLADIKTLDDLRDYMSTLGARSRILQPISSQYLCVRVKLLLHQLL